MCSWESVVENVQANVYRTKINTTIRHRIFQENLNAITKTKHKG